jgi:hypothetical protein
VPEECDIARRQRLGLWRAKLLQPYCGDQGARIVVSGVALGIVRHGHYSVLHHPGTVGHSVQMVELWQRQVVLGRGLSLHRAKNARATTVFFPGADKAFYIALGDLRPDHLAPKQIGLFAHGMARGIVVEQLDHPIGNR